MNENDKNKINSAFENIDDRLIEEASMPIRGRGITMMKRIAAACAALMVAAAIPLSLFIGQNPSREPTPQPPISNETTPETTRAAMTTKAPETYIFAETTEASKTSSAPETLPEPEEPCNTEAEALETLPEPAEPCDTEAEAPSVPEVSESSSSPEDSPLPDETPENTTSATPETSCATPEERYPTFDLDGLGLIPTLTLDGSLSVDTHLRYSEQSKESESYVTMDLTTKQLIEYFYDTIPTINLDSDSAGMALDFGSVKSYSVYRILDTSAKIPQFIEADIEITDLSQLALHPGNYYVSIEIESSCEIDGWLISNIFDAIVEVRVPASNE